MPSPVESGDSCAASRRRRNAETLCGTDCDCVGGRSWSSTGCALGSGRNSSRDRCARAAYRSRFRQGTGEVQAGLVCACSSASWRLAGVEGRAPSGQKAPAWAKASKQQASKATCFFVGGFRDPIVLLTSAWNSSCRGGNSVGRGDGVLIGGATSSRSICS